MIDPLVALSALKSVSVVLGFIMVYLAVKAYRATRRPTIFWLAVGLTFLTVAAIAEGLVYEFAKFPLEQAHVVEAIFTLIGFGALVFALYV